MFQGFFEVSCRGKPSRDVISLHHGPSSDARGPTCDGLLSIQWRESSTRISLVWSLVSFLCSCPALSIHIRAGIRYRTLPAAAIHIKFFPPASGWDAFTVTGKCNVFVTELTASLALPFLYKNRSIKQDGGIFSSVWSADQNRGSLLLHYMKMILKMWL